MRMIFIGLGERVLLAVGIKISKGRKPQDEAGE